MNEPAVDILMATYNGSEYLTMQVESVLRQTYSHWRLLIHDDGSLDDTLELIRHFQKRDKRIQLLDDGVRGLGAAGNYMHLMKHATADLCMFCDQDDIWFEDKVNKLVAVIKDERQPAAAYANAFFYKQGNTYRKTTDIHPSRLNNTLFMNSGIQGCSLIVNRQLMNLVKPFDGKIVMHDHLLTLAAITFGKLIYLDKVLMLYRQHEQNTTDNHQVNWLDRLHSFLFGKNAVVDRRHFEANYAFYAYFAARLPERDKRLFRAYFEYTETPTVMGRLKLVWKNGFQLGNRKGLLLVKTLVRKAISD
ncbi:glycosyltransferase [Parapedobacter sp. DT-150]|uniref:glycosyltransferase n=1 Tax=Parapedobacter sp. DT-150 TaxID=3396162 RepID=UPI003F1C8308